MRVKLKLTVFGSVELQAPPPPVQALLPTISTGVCVEVLIVCAPEQAVPRVALPQVYDSAPLAIVGPPAGVNSADPVTVMEADPLLVVRTRWLTSRVPVYAENVDPLSRLTVAGMLTFPIGLI